MGLLENADYIKTIHPDILKHLEARGIQDLYPPQWKAIKAGITGKNLIISIPTASGKTLIAEIIALHKNHQRQEKFSQKRSELGKILYLCPLRALANEKFTEFKTNWKSFGFRVGISTSDIDQPDFKVFKNDLIILTNEKADSILRLNPALIENIHTVICDEIHLLNDVSRGITLEFLLTLLKTINPSIQIIGLSATIKNANELATWIGGELIQSDWRPVQLREGFFIKNEIHFQDGAVRRIPELAKMDPTEQLVVDMVKEGGQILVFANSRRSAMATAEKLYPIVQKLLDADTKQHLISLQKTFKTKIQGDTSLAKKLGALIDGGVAFHHAGLGSSQLKFIVSHFNARDLKVICCTPTLAAGVNTPARRVIIKTLFRFTADHGSQLIPIIEYKQMAGRAGRPRYDPYGEVVILGSNPDKLITNALQYITGEPEAITSKLSEESALHSHLLGLIAAKITQTQEETVDFLTNSFYFYQINQGSQNILQTGSLKRQKVLNTKKLLKHQQYRRNTVRKQGRGTDPLGLFDASGNIFQTADEIWDSDQVRKSKSTKKEETQSSDILNSDPVKLQNLTQQTHEILDFFTDHDLIQPFSSQTQALAITDFGRITSHTYLPPHDAIILREDVQYAIELVKNHELTITPISWLHECTKLTSCRKFFLKKADYHSIYSFIEDHVENFIMEEIWAPSTPEFPNFAQEIKVTMILRDWISEVHERTIAERYQIGPGDLFNLINTIQWILRAFQKIIKLDAPKPWCDEIKSLYLRVSHGIKSSLLPLIKIKGIGRIRARKLYQFGYKSEEKLQEATIEELTTVPLIGASLAKTIYSELHAPKRSKKKLTKARDSLSTQENFNPSMGIKKNSQRNTLKLHKKKKKKSQNSLDKFM